MVLNDLIALDYIIIIVVGLLFIGAIIYLIINKKKGKSIACSNCPLATSCSKENKTKDCEKKI